MTTFTIISTIFVVMFSFVSGDPEWAKTMSLYQIYPRSFKDSDGDGMGDLKGIHSKLQHLVDSKFNAVWLSPIFKSPMADFGYDISDFKAIDPIFGTMEDFDNLLEEAHRLNLKVLMDFVPNHSSDEHEWFQKSVKKIYPYTEYYIWNEGKVINGTRQPPNNWVSDMYGSAWEWNNERQAYYLHQFVAKQPDLNYRNPYLVEEMKDILRFWLDKGIDGFRVDAVFVVFEVEDLRDEPLSGISNDPSSPQYLNRIYTRDLDETYGMVEQWSKVLHEYDSRVLLIETWSSIQKTTDYYKAGATFPFNFRFITDLDEASTAKNFKEQIDIWMNNMPKGAIANWVSGSHDKPRLATRFGRNFASVVTAIVQLLPGVPVTYNGEEIGMENTFLTWEQTKDPQGCNAGKAGYLTASRDPQRTPFQWDDSTSAGFSTNSSTWLPVNDNYKYLNLEAQKMAKNSNYKSFLKITSLREWPAFKSGSLHVELLNNDSVLAFSRELENEKPIYVLANFATKNVTVSLKQFGDIPANVQLYHNTADPETDIGKTFASGALDVPARSASIFVGIDPENRSRSTTVTKTTSWLVEKVNSVVKWVKKKFHKVYQSVINYFFKDSW